MWDKADAFARAHGVALDGAVWIALAEWYRPTEDLAHVDPGVVERTEAFLWEPLHEIDR